MKRITMAILVVISIFSRFSYAQEFVDFSPGTKNIIQSEMNGLKFQCFFGKNKWSLTEKFNLGDSAFIEVKADNEKADLILQSPDNPKPHSMNIKRKSSNGGSFDVAEVESGYLFAFSKEKAIYLEKVVKVGTNAYQTDFVGFCNKVEKIPSEYDIVRMGYIFRMHDYCNETRKCL